MPTPHDRYVRVRGAREHNLRGVDVDIPRDALTVFTGVSGSGKSSLAFGTIYAEAQRRYFESVAPYARRLIHQVGAPEVDEITGLPPAVALEQRRSAPSARSSVGTRHHALQLAADAVLACRRATRRAPSRLDSDAFSPNTAAGACPECHGLGRVHRATEELAGPRPVAVDPRGRDRGLAGRLAGQEPARYPRRRWATTSTGPGASCREPSGSGSCSPTSSRWSRSHPVREARTGSSAPTRART